MATTFAGELNVGFNFSVTDAGTLTTLVDRVISGVGNFDAITKSYSDGTGSGAAQKLYYTEATILTTANEDIDLKNLTSRLGVAVVFTSLKGCILVLDAPITTRKLIFKGSNASNPVALWKGDVLDDEDIHDLLVRTSSVDGWAVGASTKVMRLYNPGATSVTYRLLVWGS
jgi:hypothetical protein